MHASTNVGFFQWECYWKLTFDCFQFVTRAVRVIDLITNIDWQAFQAVNGLQVFIDRLEHEVNICRRDAPPACDSLPGTSTSFSSDGELWFNYKDHSFCVTKCWIKNNGLSTFRRRGLSAADYAPGLLCVGTSRCLRWKKFISKLKKFFFKKVCKKILVKKSIKSPSA